MLEVVSGGYISNRAGPTLSSINGFNKFLRGGGICPFLSAT